MERSRLPKVKIVCTLGPTTMRDGVLKEMIEAGMRVVRINASFADAAKSTEYIAKVREASQETGIPVGILVDLQGPKIRLGDVPGGELQLYTGDGLVLCREGAGGPGSVPVTYEGLPEDVRPGDTILIDAGMVRLKVEGSDGEEIKCRVEDGGKIASGKGVNLPGVKVGLPALLPRDKEYLKGLPYEEIDWVGLSFVRSKEDVRDLKSFMEKENIQALVISKIEKGEAVEDIDEVIKESDGVMVARGDLGVELPFEEVPLIQKRLIYLAQRSGKPVITATEMLESMVENLRPTRAETADVANAVLDGTDAVMLSEETAVGAYPVEVVEAMARIASSAEEALDHGRILRERAGWVTGSVPEAIGYAACNIAEDLSASAIITLTETGYTALQIARFRPAATVIAASVNEDVIRASSLYWGVRGVRMVPTEDFDEMLDQAIAAAKELGLAEKGDTIVTTAGFRMNVAGSTNLIRVDRIGDSK